MKILVQNSLFHPNVVGGAEVSSQLLVERLSERGWSVAVLATSGRRRGDRELTVRAFGGHGVEVFEAPSHGLVDLLPDESRGRAGFLRRSLHHLAQVHSGDWLRWSGEAMDRFAPDVVHTNTIVGMTASVWRAAHARSIPIVHTLRDYFLLCPRTTLLRSSGQDCENAPIPCRVLRSRKVNDSQLVDVVTGSSRYVLDRHLEAGAFAGARTEVIGNACEAALDAVPSRPDAPLRALYMGQLGEHKGVRVLLDAFRRVFEDPALADLEFDIAGDGPLREEVRRFCESSAGRARYHGVVRGSQKDDLLRSAAIMLVPSVWNEPFGRTVLDGFSHGMAVIGSGRGGIGEILRDGVDGRVVEPEVEPMVDALRAYHADRALLLRHAEAGLERAGEFSLERQIERFEAVYRSLSRND